MTQGHTRTVSASDAARWLASGEAVLIDVREPDEFRAEHIPAAASVPLSRITGQWASLALPEGRKIIFQCQKGGRGGQACAMASAFGTGHEVYNLDGGITSWKAAGLPVIGSTRTRAPSIFRQVQIVAGLIVLLSVLAGFSGYTAGFVIAGLIGTGLTFAGLTGWCGLALLLTRLPWNRPA